MRYHQRQSSATRSENTRLAVLASAAALTVAGCSASVDLPSQDIAATEQAVQSDEVTIGPTGKSMNYFRCAAEKGSCTIGLGSRYMAYGANGKYLFKSLSGTVSCVSATFGGDPAPGVHKSCYFSNYGLKDLTRSILATDGAMSSAVGDVAYGANGAFFFKSFNGSFTCDAATFGDPIPGVTKACYMGAPPYTRVAGEGQPMTGLFKSAVAYGSAGHFAYRVLTGTGATFTLPCNSATFGGDPASNANNACYKLTNNHYNTVPADFVAVERADWTIPTSPQALMFFGSGRNGNFVQYVASFTGTCSNAVGDPDPGVKKNCWGAAVAPPNQGKWTKVSALFPGSGPNNLQLLMDGTVLVQDRGVSTNWYRLVPDITGGYANARWQTGAIAAHYGRDYFATGMMTNGKYFVGGGERLFSNTGATLTLQNKCEVFDPTAASGNGQWSDLPDFPSTGGGNLSDGMVAPLPSGRLLVAPASRTQAYEFDPALSTWASPSSPPVGGPVFSEGSFAQLRDGKIFYAQNGFSVYDPATKAWTNQLTFFDSTNNPFNSLNSEGGPALTVYSGDVMVLGATGFNAIFDGTRGTGTTGRFPTPFVATNSTLRGQMSENGQVVMPTGNILCAVTNDFMAYTFLEYDPFGDAFTNVSYGGPDFSQVNGNLVQTPLPDGSVLVGDAGFQQLYIYRPTGKQMTSFGQPTISSVTGPVNGVYTLTGTTLNGLTNGANRDDEAQNYTSFPVVSLFTEGLQTRYANVTSVSSTSIAPGASVVVKFTLPLFAGAMVPTHGTATVRVSASGLASSNSATITY